MVILSPMYVYIYTFFAVPFSAEERDQLKELPKKECIFQSAVILHTLHGLLASSLGGKFSFT